MEQAAGHVWEPIELSWSQKLAAFWAITWPTHLTMMVVALPFAAFSVEPTKSHLALIQLLVLAAYPFCQVLWVPRLVEKRFSSFRIFAEYADGTIPKYLPIRHSIPPTICVILPQLGSLRLCG
jgi:hypothetical protein